MNHRILSNTNFAIGCCYTIAGMSICCLLSEIEISSYISIALLVYLGFSIYRIRPVFYVKYLAFVFPAIAAIIGVSVIESSHTYLKELRDTSGFAGSLPLIVLSYSILLLVMFLYDLRHDKNSNLLKNNKIQDYHEEYPRYMILLTYLTLAIYAVFWARVITRPAFLLGLNRFAYSRTSSLNMSGIWGILNGQLPLLLFFPLMSILKGYKKVGIAAILVYCLYSLWVGNKFGSFFTVLCVFLIIIYPRLSQASIKRVQKYARIAIIALAIIIILSMVIQSHLDVDSSDYLLFRTSGQGQLWWAVYKKTDGLMHAEEIGDEIKGLFSGKNSIASNVGSNYGIYKMMYYCAPASVVNGKLAGGSRYTEAGFAAAYYYMGFTGCVLFATIMALLVSSILTELIKMIRAGRYFRALLLLRLFLISRTSLSMFLFNSFFDWISISSYVILIISHRRLLQIKTKRRSVVMF